MGPVKNKRRIDPRYFLEETVDRDNLDEQDEDKEHDEDCDCTKCPEPKKKKKGKDKNGRELIQGEKELGENVIDDRIGKSMSDPGRPPDNSQRQPGRGSTRELTPAEKAAEEKRVSWERRTTPGTDPRD